MEQDDQPQGESVVSVRTVELVVATAIFLFGAVVLYDSVRLGAKWADDGPQAGYFPFYIGLILCACSIANIVATMIDAKSAAKSFVERQPLRQVLQVLVPTFLYVLGVQYIGIYVASVIFMAAFMVYGGRYSWLWSIALSTAIMVAFFVTFEIWFKVALYKGIFNPLSVIGY